MSNNAARPLTAQAKKPYGLGHLSMCALGICAFYLYYGIVQERLFTGRQRLGASFVLTTQCVTNAAVAYLWQMLQSNGTTRTTTSPHTKRRLNHVLLVLTASFYVGAMACSNEAIQYVSYPVAVLAKSCKLIPTMLVGQLLESRLYRPSEWMAALLISGGIVLFHFSRRSHGSHHPSAPNTMDDDNDQSTYGMLLLLASLCMDGVLSSCQNFLKSPRDLVTYRPPTAVETMFYINLYAVLYLYPMCWQNGQWEDGMSRLQDENSLVTAVLLLNTTVALGQIFIFLCLTWFTPLITTTITTTRKFITVVISVMLFGHTFTATQWSAVALVFGGLYIIIAVQQSTRRLKEKTKTD